MSDSTPPPDNDLAERFAILRLATDDLAPSAEFLRRLHAAVAGHEPRPRDLTWALLERRAALTVVVSSLLCVPLLLLNILIYRQLPETVSALLLDVLK